MKRMADFFGEAREDKVVLDLGKCQFCGNHELQHTPNGNPFMRSRRNCCLAQSLHRANILLGMIQDDKTPEAEIRACNDDLKDLTKDIQGLLGTATDRRAALQYAAEQLKEIQYQADVLPRILRSVGNG